MVALPGVPAPFKPCPMVPSEGLASDAVLPTLRPGRPVPPLPAGEGVFWALDGRSVPEQKDSWVRKCCQEGWLARGWFCRWCGRNEDSGWQGAARGIFGDRAKEREDVRRGFGYCACGCCLGFDWNYGSCRACYWVLTRQLVRRFVERFGSWSHIHDSIFLFLIGPQIRGRFGQITAARSQMDGLAEVRLLGVLQGSARPQQGVRRGRQGVGVEGQGRIAKRYLRGDVDWVASSARPVRARLGLAPADGGAATGGFRACCRRARPLGKASVTPCHLEPVREGSVCAGGDRPIPATGKRSALLRALQLARPFHRVAWRRRPGFEHLWGVVVRVSSLLVGPTPV